MATTKSGGKKAAGGGKKAAGGSKKAGGGKTKYGAKAGEKVERAMHERKAGTLRSGSGKKVTSRKQAIAIGLSEARKEGGKVPAKSDAGAR
jgi:Family of unknown function (DUF6496)